MINTNIFKNKKILITGHTGFKGSWLSAWLDILGANLYLVSKDIPTEPSHYKILDMSKHKEQRFDISNFSLIYKFISESKPDFIFNLAAQPLVMESYRNPYETYLTNIIGTLNILEALRQINKKCIAVMITSDKCYENTDKKIDYCEDDRLGGIDPYSSSKASAELIIRSYTDAFFSKETSNVRVCSARAGNVIGGGDWANNRIVPDCMKSWSAHKTVSLRNPKSTRPWQHVLEPLNGYISLATQLEDNADLNGEAFNFGPRSNSNHTVKDLVEQLSKHFDNSQWNISKSQDKLYEAKLLSLNCDKSYKLLKYSAKLDMISTAKLTSEWYYTFYNKGPKAASNLTIEQINYFSNLT